MSSTSIRTVEAADNPYHHGDLRRALLEAANAILAETGRWDCSLREVARRAGVSHNAPYRHFADKEALLSAIGVSGFDALNTDTGRSADGLADPVAVVRAFGKAYVRFGLANPALYRLMLGQGLPSADGLPAELRAAMDGARQRLRDVILWGARTGAFTVDPEDATEVTAAVLAAWSLVHGFTVLTIDRVVEREVGGGAPDGWADMAIERFIAGLVRSSVSPGPPRS
ncbi:TetR/AcrR family transcriptional regulator [Aureimonas sp. ME7]|uniref:TetR/AcrR family transcriptional regulator n=1 Tax=Aureimonas sp. ME7 TaxID=2744252 RepID=UPI0015F53DA4|nr:TetR/AcrR family transcriptional regulator [Aureimonas sp. ME7]